MTKPGSISATSQTWAFSCLDKSAPLGAIATALKHLRQIDSNVALAGLRCVKLTVETVLVIPEWTTNAKAARIPLRASRLIQGSRKVCSAQTVRAYRLAVKPACSRHPFAQQL